MRRRRGRPRLSHARWRSQPAGRATAPASSAARLDALSLGVLGFAADGTVIYANQAAGTLFGTEPDALTGLSFPELALIRVTDGRQLRDFRRWARVRADGTDAQFIRLGRVLGRPTVGTRISVTRPGSEPEYTLLIWPPSRAPSAEEALVNILDSARDPVVVVDDEFTIHHANQAACEAFTDSAGGLVDQPFARLLAEPLTPDDQRFIRGEPGTPGSPRLRSHRVFRCRSADGIEFTAEGAVSHTDHRDQHFHTVILRDVSERMAELATARHEMGVLRAVLDHTVAGIVAFDADDRVIAFNHRFIEMFGHTENEVHVGMARDDLVRQTANRGLYGAEDPDDVVRRRHASWQSQKFAVDELNLPDGRIVSIRRTRMPGGGTVAAYRDVTERRHQADALRDALTRLETALAVQELILEALPSRVALLDGDNVIVAVNEAWREFAGESGLRLENGGVGSDYADIARLTFAGPAESAADGIRDVLDGHRALFSFEYACHGPDHPRWFIMLAAPVGGERITGAVVMHMDVTERKLAEQRVEVSEQRQRAIIESSGDAILTLDADGLILSGNPAAERIFGHDEAYLSGLHIDALLPSFPFFQPTLDLSLAVPPLFRGEFMGVRADGTQFPVDIVMSRVQEPGSDVYIANIRDTSDQRTMQEQLIQASKLSTLGEMAAGMAHELNQPLSVMRMAADNALMRLERGTAKPDYLTEVLDLIGGQSEKLGRLILNLRVFARREESAHRLAFNPVEAIEAACQLLRGKLALDSIEICRDFPESCRLVRGGGSRLEQVVINLLSNARDAIMERREKEGTSQADQVRISVHDEGGNGLIRISLEDTGCGISEQNIPKLFNPFFTTKGIGKGTGLGLSISYGIITSMGGTLAATNVPGGGARFEITLPAEAETGTQDRQQAVPGSLPLMQGEKQ